jgi:hypothetical protein
MERRQKYKPPAAGSTKAKLNKDRENRKPNNIELISSRNLDVMIQLSYHDRTS